MRSATKVLRLFRTAVHICNAFVRVTVLFPWCSAAARRHQIADWSRKTLSIFGLRKTTNALPSKGGDPRLYVANHVSWLDVFAIWSQTDAIFVAKGEVGLWPVIGPLARRLGVVFIDRSRRRDAMTASRHIAALLAQGRSVCIFPEGTSTEGRELRSFHSALFQSVVETGVAVQPIAIRYFREDGALATEAAFTGDMSLVQSMWHLAGANPIIIEIGVLPLIDSAGLDRRILAVRAHELIGRRLREPVNGWPLEPHNTLISTRPFAKVTSFDPAVP